MKLEITYKKIRDTVAFPYADQINRKKLADLLGCTPQMVGHMLKTGDVPDRFLEPLKSIPIASVLNYRTIRKSKEEKS